MGAAAGPELVAIVGATAVGKTEITLAVAERFGGEIVNADATAMYRHLDVGAAKPGAEELARVPHHLVDVSPPDQPITLGAYQRLAYEAIDDVASRGKVAFLVGGSGLFVNAVLEGYRIPPGAASGGPRAALEAAAAEKGSRHLYDRLLSVDPQAAESIHPNNLRRIVRALEVYEATGEPISSFWRRREVRYRSLRVGLTRERAEIYARIDRRIRAMIERGLIDEVRHILDLGYPPDSHALSAIGYKELVPYLEGRIGLEEAVAQIQRATRKLARLQLTSWFPPGDERITWFDVGTPGALDEIVDFLAGRGLRRGERSD